MGNCHRRNLGLQDALKSTGIGEYHRWGNSFQRLFLLISLKYMTKAKVLTLSCGIGHGCRRNPYDNYSIE